LAQHARLGCRLVAAHTLTMSPRAQCPRLLQST
jgi:hypothetical protein